jgi:hypothetical protein
MTRNAMPTAAVSELAAHCPPVVGAGRIAAWVGEGRAVTAKGLPRRPDLPALAAALGVQVVMDWDGGHLNAFTADGATYSDRLGDPGDEDAVRLAQALPRAGSRIAYIYDFGDSWQHDIVLEAIVDPDDSISYPTCVGGHGDAPVEDWSPDVLEEPQPFDRDYINARLRARLTEELVR